MSQGRKSYHARQSSDVHVKQEPVEDSQLLKVPENPAEAAPPGSNLAGLYGAE